MFSVRLICNYVHKRRTGTIIDFVKFNINIMNNVHFTFEGWVVIDLMETTEA